MKKNKNKNWLFVICFLLISISLQMFLTNSVLAECKEGEGNICLNAPLPGLEKGVSAEKGAVGIMTEYVGAIFKFGAGLVIIVAVIMIIIGGYETMIKGGIEGNMAGKERILQALVGLVLIFLSALILHSINPTFFTFGDGGSGEASGNITNSEFFDINK